MTTVWLVLGLLLFIGLVIVHEWGHLLAARRNGIEVEEFGIGLPPKAYGRKTKSGMLLSLNWLPLGGFVKLKGEHDADTAKGSYGAASLSAKVQVMLAGVGMNLLTAFIIFTVLAWVGLPKLLENQFTVASDTKTTASRVFIGVVEKESPAASAGLKSEDELLAIGNAPNLTQITSADSLPTLTKQLAGKQVSVSYKRDGNEQTAKVSLRTEAEVAASKKSNHPKGYLGVSPAEYTLRRSTWSAPVVSVGLIKQITVMTFQGIGRALSNVFHGNASQAGNDVAGPVGIFFLLKNGSQLGPQFMLVIIAVISLTLAIMNVLPFPALDGGRLFLTLFYRVIRRPLTKHREELINFVGFMALLALFVVITVVDIRRH